MTTRFSRARKGVLVAIFVSLSFPPASLAAPSHAGGNSPPTGNSAPTQLPVCVASPTTEAIARLIPNKNTAAKVVTAFKNMAQKPPTEWDKDIADLKKVAKGIPLGVLFGILASPEMGLDEAQRKALTETEKPSFDDAINFSIKSAAKNLVGKEGELKALVKAVTDAKTPEGEVASLVNWSHDNGIPLGLLLVILEVSEVKRKDYDKINGILKANIAEKGAVQMNLDGKTGRWAFGSEGKADPKIAQKLIGLQTADVADDNKLTSDLSDIAKLAEQHKLTYFLPQILGVSSADDTKKKSPVPFCFLNGPAATEKRDKLESALAESSNKNLLDLHEQTALGTEPSLQKPELRKALSVLQDQNATDQDLRAALDVVFSALKNPSAGLGELPDMVAFLKGIKGLNLTEPRKQAIEKLFLEKALAESGAKLPTNAKIRGLIADLRAEKDPAKIASLVNQILAEAHSAKIAKDVEKYLSAGVITMDAVPARAIRQALAIGTMDPNLKLSPDGLPNVMKSRLLSDLGKDTKLDDAWKKKAQTLANDFSQSPQALKALEHLMKKGYFTPRQAENLRVALALAQARKVAAEKQQPERPKVVANPTFLPAAKKLYGDLLKNKLLDHVIAGRTGNSTPEERQALKEYQAVQSLNGQQIIDALVKPEGISEFTRAAMADRLKEALKAQKLDSLANSPTALTGLVADMAALAGHTDLTGDLKGFEEKAEALLRRAGSDRSVRQSLIDFMNGSTGPVTFSLSEGQKAGLKAMLAPKEGRPTTHAGPPPTPPSQPEVAPPPPRPAETAQETLVKSLLTKCATCHKAGSNRVAFNPQDPMGFVRLLEGMVANNKISDPIVKIQQMYEDYAESRKMTAQERDALKAFVETNLRKTVAGQQPPPPPPPRPEPAPVVESPRFPVNRVVAANPSLEVRQRIGLPQDGRPYYVLTDDSGNISRFVQQGEVFAGSFFGQNPGAFFRVDNGGTTPVNFVTTRRFCLRCRRRH